MFTRFRLKVPIAYILRISLSHQNELAAQKSIAMLASIPMQLTDFGDISQIQQHILEVFKPATMMNKRNEGPNVTYLMRKVLLAKTSQVNFEEGGHCDVQ